VNGEEEAKILQAIHEQMGRGEEINVPDSVFEYNKKFPGEGALRLLQDLQKMRFVYNNLVEEVKRIDAEKFSLPAPEPSPQENAANAIRNKYIGLGMVPENYLPSTSPWQLLKCGYESLKKLWNAEITLLSSYNREITSAMRLEPGTTVTFQIGLQVVPQTTIGWERTVN
jgi:hypothetical protein